jgi:hypothetical protein
MKAKLELVYSPLEHVIPIIKFRRGIAINNEVEIVNVAFGNK